MKIDVRLLEIDKLLPHEYPNYEKLPRLCTEIINDGFIKDPVQCYKYKDKYIILDGHHRVEAIKNLGGKFVPAQIVKRDDIRVEFWIHSFILFNVGSNYVYEEFQFGDLKIGEYFNSNTGELHPLFSKLSDKDSILNTINSISEIYRNNYEVTTDRPQHCDYIIFNGLSFEKITELASSGLILPPKITKFVIDYRVLNLRTPLNSIYEGMNDSWDTAYRRIEYGRVFNEPILYI